jgi:hypothetical protein
MAALADIPAPGTAKQEVAETEEEAKPAKPPAQALQAESKQKKVGILRSIWEVSRPEKQRQRESPAGFGGRSQFLSVPFGDWEDCRICGGEDCSKVEIRSSKAI